MDHEGDSDRLYMAWQSGRAPSLQIAKPTPRLLSLARFLSSGVLALRRRVGKGRCCARRPSRGRGGSHCSVGFLAHYALCRLEPLKHHAVAATTLPQLSPSSLIYTLRTAPLLYPPCHSTRHTAPPCICNSRVPTTPTSWMPVHAAACICVFFLFSRCYF